MTDASVTTAHPAATNLLLALGAAASVANALAALLAPEAYFDFLATHLTSDGEIRAPFSTAGRISLLLLLIGLTGPILAYALRRLRDPGFRPTLLAFYGFLGFYLVLRFTLLRGHPEEDGVIENLQAAGAFVAGLGALWLAFRVRRDAASAGWWLFAVLGALLIVYAGEEVSWGQRLFDWHSPELFAKYNDQQETNIHNFANADAGTIWFVFFGACLLLSLVSRRIVDALRARFSIGPSHPLSLVPRVQWILMLELVLVLLLLLGEGELAEEVLAITVVFVVSVLIRLRLGGAGAALRPLDGRS